LNQLAGLNGAPAVQPEPEWTTPQLTEIPSTAELRRLYREATDGRDACAATEQWT
jgi:hypothetical protein